MTRIFFPSASPTIRTLHDDAGTPFAVEVMHAEAWDEALRTPPAAERADVRVVLLSRGGVPGRLPAWLAVVRAAIATPDLLTHAATQAWHASPAFRTPEPRAESYMVAGVQALCPPHSPCPVRADARDELVAFLHERPGPLGSLALVDRDGFDRLLRVHWPTPEAFAQAILRERMRDLGGGAALDLIRSLESAAGLPDVDDHGYLEAGRAALLERLSPLQYFLEPAAFEAARGDVEAWLEQHAAAFDASYRRIHRSAVRQLVDLVPVLTAAAALQELNRQERPVGEASCARFIDEVEVLRQVVTGQGREGVAPVSLVRASEALALAPLSAAAVLAAVDVHRRRIYHFSRSQD
ncbi:MAG: hypothetical protein Q8M79_01990 [Dehalococcoidia bacterium]|nr:hypothetical protein [Dehalococcoidia bacterium]